MPPPLNCTERPLGQRRKRGRQEEDGGERCLIPAENDRLLGKDSSKPLTETDGKRKKKQTKKNWLIIDWNWKLAAKQSFSNLWMGTGILGSKNRPQKFEKPWGITSVWTKSRDCCPHLYRDLLHQHPGSSTRQTDIVPSWQSTRLQQDEEVDSVLTLMTLGAQMQSKCMETVSQKPISFYMKMKTTLWSLSCYYYHILPDTN